MKGADANPGDLIRIKTAKEDIEGILIESYEPGVVLIKLDSGYNIGISRDNILDMKVVKKAEKKQEKESEFKQSHKKPVIDLIMTGGTISSSLDSKTGAVKALTSPNDFFKMYPDILEFADVNIINPFMKLSENMGPSDWQKIAKIVVKSLNNDNVKGVILTHGTDTLHYTSAALSFMIRNLNKPVVLTYSQRSSDRGSSDAKFNLICAAKMALSDIAEVMIVGHADSNDESCNALLGTKVRKMHSSRRDAFKPINSSPVAKITHDKIEILRGDYNKRKHLKEGECSLDDSFDSRVALVKFYPGQSPEILEYYAKSGYKGIIIEMTGLGHVCVEGSLNWVPVIKDITSKGIVVCAAAQTLYGRLDPLVYSTGRELEKAGVIYLKDILPETAFVKLGWVLGHKEWKNDVREKMLENISKEFNERLGEES